MRASGDFRPTAKATLLLSIVLLTGLFLVACSGDDYDDVAPTPTPATEGASGSEVEGSDSISIPAIEVDAPLTPRQLVEGQPLPSPDGPYDVAIYDFGDQPVKVGDELVELGGAPGQGGNVVLSGLNLAVQGCISAEPPCGAVFRSLRNLKEGAAVDLTWQGDVYDYQVVAMCVVSTADFNDGLYRRTAEEQLTLLTGAGEWNSARGWSHVLVVIAKPAPRTAVEPCPEGTQPLSSQGA